MKQYKMRLEGFLGNISKGEQVTVLNINHGVCQVENKDEIQDYAHVDDLIEIVEGEDSNDKV